MWPHWLAMQKHWRMGHYNWRQRPVSNCFRVIGRYENQSRHCPFCLAATETGDRLLADDHCVRVSFNYVDMMTRFHPRLHSQLSPDISVSRMPLLTIQNNSRSKLLSLRLLDHPQRFLPARDI